MSAVAQSLPGMTAGPADLGERLSALRRHSRLAAWIFGGILLVTLLLALLWPATYRSAGTVLIEQQEVPENFVQAAITSFADQRVRMISQRVMTTTNLLDIIKRYDLYPQHRRTEPRERLLERMRDDIGLEMISADVIDPRQGRPTKATIAFMVSYDSRSASVAAKVANELTTLFLNENLETRKRLAEDTAGFLRSEAERVGAELAEIDQRLADFRSAHSGALPELAQVNIQLLTRLEEELRSVDSRTTALDQQIVFLDSQLAQIEPSAPAYGEGGQRILGTADRLKLLKTNLASAAAVYGPEHPDVLRIRREIAGLEQATAATAGTDDLVLQLADAKRQLDRARARYSPEHPDVVRLERVVATIESLVPRAAPPQARRQPEVAPDNPAYIQILAQRDAALTQRSALYTQRADLRGRIADFEERLAQAPEVEREYNVLRRDLEGAQLKYQEVRQKQMAAQVAANMESERKGERFELIEPPIVAEKPISPNRPLILAAGLLLALAAALGVPMLLESVQGRVSSRADLTRLLKVAPLAVIPEIETEQDDRDPRVQKRRLLILGAGLLATLLLLVAVHVWLRPLDVLWHVLLRKLGL
jgi:polysaccharide biosynthesis transport protein